MDKLDSDGLLDLLQDIAKGGVQIASLSNAQLGMFLALASVAAVSAIEALGPSAQPGGSSDPDAPSEADAPAQGEAPSQMSL